ncbi:MAG: alkaline phosphatase family protein [Patescibacteria group bacterium]|nr:alkaline phosphatase family protein [Patescibacteria group bacterium]
MDNTKPSGLPVGRDKAILFVLIDAFRWDYLTLEDAPTIFELTKNSVYVKKLKSSSGFTQRSTIFTGAMPDEHGNYTMYVYDPKTSPFRMLKPFTGILKYLKPGSFLYRVTRKFINQLPKLTADYAPPGRIPFELLPLISVVEDMTPIHEKGTLPLESLFDTMREANVPFDYHMAPVSGHDEPTMQEVLAEIDRGGQVFFVQFSDTDGKVHEAGVASETRHRVVREVDERVRKLKEAMEKKFGDPWIVICGDHGMVDCTEYIDIWGMVERHGSENGLENGRDYLLFLDSTLARFWFFNEKARTVLKPFLEEHLRDKGEWIDEEYMRSQHIPKNDAWHGEMIWKADVRVGIFPDYFHGPDDRYIGMHGFDCREDTMKGAGVFSHKDMIGQVLIEEGGLEQICATLCDMLEIPRPDTATGESFFRTQR